MKHNDPLFSSDVRGWTIAPLTQYDSQSVEPVQGNILLYYSL